LKIDLHHPPSAQIVCGRDTLGLKWDEDAKAGINFRKPLDRMGCGHGWGLEYWTGRLAANDLLTENGTSLNEKDQYGH
jgi:hypothetical protein